jgi:hypothetical protein
MASIFDIPAELLEEILSLLQIADLSRLSRACVILHSFLTPRVYHTQDWYWEDDHPSPPYHLLLRTLLSNVQLAGYVKVLKLRGGAIVKEEAWKQGYRDDEDDGWLLTNGAQTVWTVGQCLDMLYTPQEIQAVTSVLSSISSYGNYREEAIQEFERGNVDVIIALILQQVRAIEHLDLGFGYLHRSKFIPRTLRHLLYSKAIIAFPHLVSANLALDGPRSPEFIRLDLDIFRPLFTLQRLAKLDTILSEPTVFAWPSPTEVPHAVWLSTLVLRSSTASEATLEMILSCTPNLKRLVYDHHRMVGMCDPHWECCEEFVRRERTIPTVLLHGPRLSKALAHVKDTLESLVLKVRFTSDVWTEFKDLQNSQYLCGMIGRVSGLEMMPKLTTLDISWVLLLGWEPDYEWSPGMLLARTFIPEADTAGFPWSTIMPPNIQVLRIRDDLSDFWHYPHRSFDVNSLVKSIVSNHKRYFRALIRLDFVYISKWPYGQYRGSPELFETLTGICQRHGILTSTVQESCLVGPIEVQAPGDP